MHTKEYKSSLPTSYTIPELMRIGRCSKSTAYRWVHSGRVKSIRIGRKILIPKAEISKLLSPNPKASV